MDTPITTKTECIVSGCSSEICATESFVSACIFKCEFGCIQRFAKCGTNINGECQWEGGDEYKKCLDDCDVPVTTKPATTKADTTTSSLQEGDVCGVPGIDCPALKCACRQCPNGVGEWGCCSQCVIDANGECSGFTPEESCKNTKPTTTAVNETKTTIGEGNCPYPCISYFDGCNNCRCNNPSSIPVCTRKVCQEKGEFECYLCDEGYVLNNGECVDDGANKGFKLSINAMICLVSLMIFIIF